MVRSNELNQLQKLVGRWESGDKEAGNTFIERIEPLVRHHVQRLGYGRFESRVGCDDLTQIILLNIAQAAKSKKLSTTKNLLAWLRRVVKYTVNSEIRDHCAQKRDWRRQSQFDESTTDRCRDSRQVDAMKLMVDEILQSLSVEERELALQLANGNSQTEIATSLKVHPRTIRRRITALRVPFSKYFAEPSAN